MTNPEEKTEKTVKVRRHRILSHPILGCILLTIYAFLFYQIAAEFGKSDMAGSVLSIISAALLLLIHRLWFRREFKGALSLDFLKDRKIFLVVGVFLAVDIILAIAGYISVGFAAPTAVGIMMALGAGTVEETVFRVLPVSIMMRAYKDKANYLVALILPAIIFGGIHMLNVLGGQNVGFTIMQAISAGLSGIFLGALYLRTGSIIPSMFCHALHDMFCSMQADQTSAISTATGVTTSDIISEIVSMILCIALAIWLLKGQSDKVREVWQGIWKTEDIESKAVD